MALFSGSFIISCRFGQLQGALRADNRKTPVNFTPGVLDAKNKGKMPVIFDRLPLKWEIGRIIAGFFPLK